LKPGEILGLLAQNGAGKTTIISILTTLETASKGVARIFGHDVRSKDLAIKNMFGLVPQELVSHGFFSVEEVLTFTSGYHGLKHNKEQIEFLLEKLGLKEHRMKKVAQLSGGMKRRFLIAKALVHKPPLLLLDEPTAGVDIELRNTLWGFVRELNAAGTAILLTTHYLEEAEQLCDRIAIIDRGEIKKLAPTQELIQKLTQRQVRLSVRVPSAPINSPFLVKQTDSELIFRLPSAMVLGELLQSVKIQPDVITDIRIQEGTLQDAFLQVLGEKR
jgi:ABC-2 type transport system ATP-binding protein